MKFQVMRELTQSEYAELKESIIQNGVLVPIVVDENGNIIDGHHRKKICDELHITDYPKDVKAGLNEEEKINMAHQLNEARRQLTAEEKRQEIERRLKETPELSDRQIAKQVEASPTTVGTMRKNLENVGELSKLDTSIGADGKEYPRQLQSNPVEPVEEFDEDQITFEEDIPAEARENDDLPTRTRVLDLVETRKKQEQNYYNFLDEGHKLYKEFVRVVEAGRNLKTSDNELKALAESLQDATDRNMTKILYDSHIEYIDETIKNLNKIKLELIKGANEKKCRIIEMSN